MEQKVKKTMSDAEKELLEVEKKERRKKFIIGEVKNYILIVIGSICCSLAYVFFLTPSKFSAGGVGGLAITFHYLFGINVGLATFLMNIPLFIIGMRSLGRMYGLRTLIGIVLIAFFIDLLDGKYISSIRLMPPEELDPIIAALFGGLVLGIGLGILFRGKGSSGGSDIIAQVMGKYTSFTPGIAIMAIDFNVIVFSGILLGTIGVQEDVVASGPNQWELIFYGFIALYVSSKVIDIVLEGLSTNKSVQIISSKKDEILEYIHEMGRGATILKGVGAYTKQERDVIFVVVSRKELTQLKDYLTMIDDRAFMIIEDAHQVLGYGFAKFEKSQGSTIGAKKKEKKKVEAGK